MFPTLKIDGAMRTAYTRRGIPLWVPPSEADSYLRYRNWSEQICIELRDWFARKWSMAFAAGYRKVAPPKVERSDVYQMLSKMGYAADRANELADILVDGLPGMYKKGLTMGKITVTAAGQLASSALKAICGSVVLLEAFTVEWQRTTRDMAEVSHQSSGDLAFSTLKSAMDKVQTRSDQRENLIGMFCNEWNLLSNPGAHRGDPSHAMGARATRSHRG